MKNTLKVFDGPYLAMVYGTLNGKRVTLFAADYLDAVEAGVRYMKAHGAPRVKAEVLH